MQKNKQCKLFIFFVLSFSTGLLGFNDSFISFTLLYIIKNRIELSAINRAIILPKISINKNNKKFWPIILNEKIVMIIAENK